MLLLWVRLSEFDLTNMDVTKGELTTRSILHADMKNAGIMERKFWEDESLSKDVELNLLALVDGTASIRLH